MRQRAYRQSLTMNIRHHLLREAGKLASSQALRRVELAADLGQLECGRTLSSAEKARLQELRAMSEICEQALPRFTSYLPHQTSEINCPYCWIIGGEIEVLKKDSRSEIYRCARCRGQYPSSPL